MERKWTREQKAAIDTHGANLLVAAAAGSGAARQAARDTANRPLRNRLIRIAFITPISCLFRPQGLHRLEAGGLDGGV